MSTSNSQKISGFSSATANKCQLAATWQTWQLPSESFGCWSGTSQWRWVDPWGMFCLSCTSKKTQVTQGFETVLLDIASPVGFTSHLSPPRYSQPGMCMQPARKMPKRRPSSKASWAAMVHPHGFLLEFETTNMCRNSMAEPIPGRDKQGPLLTFPNPSHVNQETPSKAKAAEPWVRIRQTIRLGTRINERIRNPCAFRLHPKFSFVHSAYQSYYFCQIIRTYPFLSNAAVRARSWTVSDCAA